MKDSLNEENSSLGFIEAVINGNEDKVIFSGLRVYNVIEENDPTKKCMTLSNQVSRKRTWNIWGCLFKWPLLASTNNICD